jgi:hypothetical protein
MEHQNSIQKLFAQKGEFYEPLPFSKHVLSSGCQLHPAFVAMVREQLFLGMDHGNPDLHLREFEQLCSCLLIPGVTQQTFKRKLFPFSISERAKQWYAHTVGSINDTWDELQKNFVSISSQ